MIDSEKITNIEAEEALIGAILINPTFFFDIRGTISPSDFSNSNCKNAWIAFENIACRNSKIDLITSQDELSKVNHLNINEAGVFFSSVITKTPTSENALYYAKIVKEYSIKRIMLSAYSEQATRIYDPRSSIEDLIESDSTNSRFFRDLAGSKSSEPKILDSSDAYKDIKPINWIIEDLIASETINMLVGDGGTKKTFISLWMAVCISNGLDFLGFKSKKSKVLYIDEEMGESFFLQRIRACEEGAQTQAKNPMLISSCFGFNLTRNADIQELEDLISENGVDLVILDAFSSMMGDSDENLSKDTSPFFLNLRQICKNEKCAFLIIHHTNKTNSYRGSTDIKSKVDLLLQINSKSSSNIIEFESEKVRNGKPLTFKGLCNWVDDKFWITRVYKDNPAILSEEENYILEYLRENGETTRSLLINSSDVFCLNQLNSSIYSLMKKDLIYRTNNQEKGRGKEAKYDLR